MTGFTDETDSFPLLGPFSSEKAAVEGVKRHVARMATLLFSEPRMSRIFMSSSSPEDFSDESSE